MKTTSMQTVSSEVHDKNKEYYLRSEDKAEKSYDVSRHVQLQHVNGFINIQGKKVAILIFARYLATKSHYHFLKLIWKLLWS